MRIFKIIILNLLVFLSLAAGAAKVLQLPDEVNFFQNAGIDAIWVVVFGVLQLAGGGLLIFYKTRVAGLIVTALMFLASTIIILINGMIGFAAFSLFPVLVAGYLLVARNQ